VACWRCKPVSSSAPQACGVYLVPSLAVALIASIIIGLEQRRGESAGSEVLQRFTPPAHRNFVFLDQAGRGVPLGGVVAGLTIPPLVNSLGWRWALVVAAQSDPSSPWR
jgi:hypothetical protein